MYKRQSLSILVQLSLILACTPVRAEEAPINLDAFLSSGGLPSTVESAPSRFLLGSKLEAADRTMSLKTLKRNHEQGFCIELAGEGELNQQLLDALKRLSAAQAQTNPNARRIADAQAELLRIQAVREQAQQFTATDVTEGDEESVYLQCQSPRTIADFHTHPLDSGFMPSPADFSHGHTNNGDFGSGYVSSFLVAHPLTNTASLVIKTADSQSFNARKRRTRGAIADEFAILYALGHAASLIFDRTNFSTLDDKEFPGYRFQEAFAFIGICAIEHYACYVRRSGSMVFEKVSIENLQKRIMAMTSGIDRRAAAYMATSLLEWCREVKKLSKGASPLNQELDLSEVIGGVKAVLAQDFSDETFRGEFSMLTNHRRLFQLVSSERRGRTYPFLGTLAHIGSTTPGGGPVFSTFDVASMPGDPNVGSTVCIQRGDKVTGTSSWSGYLYKADPSSGRFQIECADRQAPADLKSSYVQSIKDSQVNIRGVLGPDAGRMISADLNKFCLMDGECNPFRESFTVP